jgi:hypothetical protein
MEESHLVRVQEREKTARSESEKPSRPAQNCGIAEFELPARLIAKKDQWTLLVFVAGLGDALPKTKWLSILVAGLFIPAIGIWQASYGQQAQLPAAVSSPPAPTAAMGSTGSTHERLEQEQAEYYKAQIDKIKGSSWLKDYATILGALVAALVAAIAGLITLRLNLGATLKGQADSRQNQKEILEATLGGQADARSNQQETQFYEALKRLGDKDSPMVRSGAVGLLADMSLQDRNRQRFLNLALNLLCEALMEEENDTVIRAVVRALERFSEVVPDDVVKKLIPLNKELQEPFATSAFELRCHRIEDDKEGTIGDCVWPIKAVGRACRNLNLDFLDTGDRCAAWAVLDSVIPEVIRELTPENNVILHNIEWLERVGQRREEIEGSEKSEELKDLAVRDAHIAGIRLWATTAALRRALSSCEEIPPSNEISMAGLFLPRASLQNRDFRGKNLSRAVLSGSGLEGAHLDHADLTEAKLQSAILKGANLTGAKLNGASLFRARVDGADLTQSIWWRANFWGISLEALPCFDGNLVQELYDAWGDGVPLDLTEEKMYPSVRSLIEKFRREAVRGSEEEAQHNRATAASILTQSPTEL